MDNMDSKELISMGGITVVFILVLSFFPMVAGASTVKFIIHDDGPFGPNDPYGPGIVKSPSECEEVVEAEDGTFSGEVYSFPLVEGDSNEQVLLMGYQSSVTMESDGKSDVLYVQHTRSDYTDGHADYYVDGEYVTTVNTRMRGTWYLEIAGLKNKAHTLTVVANPTQVTVDYACFGDKKTNKGKHLGVLKNGEAAAGDESVE